jgi:signal peptidase II
MTERRGAVLKLSSWALKLGIVGLAAAMVGCDHATKVAAQATLGTGKVVPIFDHIVELRFAANNDTAFSVLHLLGVPRTHTSTSVLTAFAVLATVGVIVAWLGAARRSALATSTAASRVLLHAGFALVLAGALGNVVDRAVRGYVVDFIHVARWPVFNVADIAVVAGSLLLGLLACAPKPTGASH